MTIHSYSDQELREQFERRERSYARTLSVQFKHAQLFAPFKIPHAEHRVLAYLLFYGGTEPSVVADSLMILRQTMTKVIDSLEAKGLAERVEHPSDRRKVFVKLLPEGERIAREQLSIEADFLDRVYAEISEEDQAEYHRLNDMLQETRDRILQEILDERSARQA